MAVGVDIFQLLLKPVLQLFCKFPLASSFLFHICGSDLDSFSKSYHSWHIFRSSPAIALMMATANERLHSCTSAHIQEANAFWPIYLMSGHGQEVNPQFINVYRDFTYSLHCICV